jgi:hypothetical protein
VLPTLPVIDLARRQGARVTFIGSRSGLEARLLAGEDLDYVATWSLRAWREAHS